MRAFQLLLTLFGALAVLTLGAAPAGAATAMPSCHEMSGEPAREAPDKPMKTMGCCVVCVATPIAPPVDGAATPLPRTRIAPKAIDLWVGLTPAPEHGPPRA
ncbi:MAG: hypothetical protein EON90_04595 [Brevundimonas sp.]|nr:MAG: hypothetical protein EON90_04595 [Brevundimonas sp.]